MLALDGWIGRSDRTLLVVSEETTGISGDGRIHARRPGGDAPLEMSCRC